MGWAQLDVVLPADDSGLGGAGLLGGRPARVMPPASANRDCGRHAHHELLSPCEYDATLPKQPSRDSAPIPAHPTRSGTWGATKMQFARRPHAPKEAAAGGVTALHRR